MKKPTLKQVAQSKRKQPINHPWNRGYPNNAKLVRLAQKLGAR